MSPPADSQVLEVISGSLKRIANRLDVLEQRDHEDLASKIDALRETIGAMREALAQHTASEEARFMGIERRLASLEIPS